MGDTAAIDMVDFFIQKISKLFSVWQKISSPDTHHTTPPHR